MDLDALFDSKNDVDTIEADAEVEEAEEVEVPETEDALDESGIGWKALALFISGGLVITALAVAFMVWVIEGLVL